LISDKGNILLQRLSKYTDKIIGNYQAGFRKDRWTSDQIHALRQMLEKTLEYNISTYHLFVLILNQPMTVWLDHPFLTGNARIPSPKEINITDGDNTENC